MPAASSLGDVEAAPIFLKGNPHIRNGYRLQLTYFQCVRSIFMVTNETINIWSHLLGSVWFVILLFNDNILVIPAHGGSLTDHIVISLSILSFIGCLVLSTGFHIFNCHSEDVYQKWLAYDLAGISTSLYSCYIFSLYYGFYCYKFYMWLYLSLVTGMVGIITYLHTHPQFLSTHWHFHRTGIYCLLVLFGLIPACHWLFIMGGLQNAMVQVFLPKILIMYGLGLMAFSFYVTKVPERFFPGAFDYVGASHQWWHILIVLAFAWWHRAGLEIMQYRLRYGCRNLYLLS